MTPLARSTATYGNGLPLLRLTAFPVMELFPCRSVARLTLGPRGIATSYLEIALFA
jgi:hypothetical protein